MAGLISALVTASLLLNQAAGSGYVRPTSARLRAAVAQALHHSPAFRTLLAALHRQHTIVYVVPGRCDFGRREGCLLHSITEAGGCRVTRTVVRDDLPPVRLAGVIAHELQHAAELGEHNVRRSEEIAGVLQRIGYPCESAYARACYETAAAVAVQERVRSDLSRARDSELLEENRCRARAGAKRPGCERAQRRQSDSRPTTE